MKHFFAIFKHWILFNFIECFCGKKFLKNWFSILTWRILTMDRIAWYFLRSLYMVSDIFSLSSETCFEVISEKNQIFLISKEKFLFPLPTLSISIIILLYLAVCAKTWMEWKKWLRKRTKVLMICQNHDVPFNFWDPFDPRKWICNRKSWRTVVSKSPKISRYFLRENSNYFNLK